MKTAIQNHVKNAIAMLVEQQQFSADAVRSTIHVERTKDPSHGDFACNIAMQLAGVLKSNPRQIATQLVEQLATQALFERVEIAGPGFINFYLSQGRYNHLIQQIFEEKTQFGTVAPSTHSPKVLVEFVSANPTGPLHVGHGRGAAYGATLANVLRAAGQHVDCEYYINDAGRQMDILALSVYLRYLQIIEQPEVIYPTTIYQADYCREIAADIARQRGEQYRAPDDFFKALVIEDYPAYLLRLETLANELVSCEARLSDEDKQRIDAIKNAQSELKSQGEQFIDQLIARAKLQLGEKSYQYFLEAALDSILADIKEDLHEFGVDHDYWFSERSLFDTGKIEAAIAELRDKGYLYEKNGALWFRTTDLGDEKDRVVQRDNGLYTYFASDIAYHHDKIQRGYDHLIDIFGADHHGYMARVRAALVAFGHDPARLQFELVQFAVLYQGGEKMQMSTRSGQYVTLRDLRSMIGNSAVRFFYVMRKPQQHLDFDLDLAVATNKDNPLYYIQYAHARICRLLNKAVDNGITLVESGQGVEQLTSEHEQQLLRTLEAYSDMLQTAANDYAPHQIVHYLKALATALHSYYDAGNIKFLEKDELQLARLALLSATRQVLANGLQLAGVDAPQTM